jgi:1-acyl-sn-glycerol-3-phosphate acyltransferase
MPVDAVNDAREDELAELDRALESLRTEIRSRFPAGPRPSSSFGVPALVSIFSELRQRLATFGMHEQPGDVDEFGMDEVALRRARPLLELLFDTWWRVEVKGLERLPPTGPCLLAANRSGLVPYDGLMLANAVARFDPRGLRPAFMVDDRMAALPFVQPYLARLGGVRACSDNARRLLGSGRRVIAFPEGARGATKLFRERYRLQRFARGGVVRVALQTQAPLVPVGVVGAEEAHPVLFKTHGTARAVGFSFLPVTPTFPLLGPLGLVPFPTKWTMRFGEPLELRELPPDAEHDELLVSRLTEQLRSRVQELVDRALSDRESVWD